MVVINKIYHFYIICKELNAPVINIDCPTEYLKKKHICFIRDTVSMLDSTSFEILFLSKIFFSIFLFWE